MANIITAHELLSIRTTAFQDHITVTPLTAQFFTASSPTTIYTPQRVDTIVGVVGLQFSTDVEVGIYLYSHSTEIIRFPLQVGGSIGYPLTGAIYFHTLAFGDELKIDVDAAPCYMLIHCIEFSRWQV